MLKDFLKELFKHSPKGNTISEDKLIEYTDNIVRFFASPKGITKNIFMEIKFILFVWF